ncbi:hypothetical protein D3C84_1291640 [compost metagenome]
MQREGCGQQESSTLLLFSARITSLTKQHNILASWGVMSSSGSETWWAPLMSSLSVT